MSFALSVVSGSMLIMFNFKLSESQCNGEMETQIANAVHSQGLASTEEHMFQSRAKLLKQRMASNSGWNYLLVNERFPLFSAHDMHVSYIAFSHTPLSILYETRQCNDVLLTTAF